MNFLKPGDPCPCCGNPIKTTDPQDLYALTVLADWVERHSQTKKEPPALYGDDGSVIIGIDLAEEGAE